MEQWAVMRCQEEAPREKKRDGGSWTVVVKVYGKSKLERNKGYADE